MRKTKTKKKWITVALMLTLLLPSIAKGQVLFYFPGDEMTNNGLLGRGGIIGVESVFTHQSFGNYYDGLFTHQSFGNNYDGDFTHQTFGYDAPIGNELFILLTAVIGYAFLKREKRKTTIIN